MTILALDLATVTGWAVAVPPYHVAPTPREEAAGMAVPLRVSGAKSFRAHSGNIGACADAFVRWLDEMVSDHKPDLIVFEAPFAGAVRNANTGRMLFGFCALAEMVAYRHEIRVLECNNATVKKHATGSGRADKKQMVAAARARGWNPQDDNEADALWLLDYACACLAAKASAA